MSSFPLQWGGCCVDRQPGGERQQHLHGQDDADPDQPTVGAGQGQQSHFYFRAVAASSAAVAYSNSADITTTYKVDVQPGETGGPCFGRR